MVNCFKEKVIKSPVNRGKFLLNFCVTVINFSSGFDILRIFFDIFRPWTPPFEKNSTVNLASHSSNGKKSQRAVYKQRLLSLWPQIHSWSHEYLFVGSCRLTRSSKDGFLKVIGPSGVQFGLYLLE